MNHTEFCVIFGENMEYIKLEHDLYEGKHLSWPIMFGMQNFQKPGTPEYRRAQRLIKENKVIDGYDANNGYIVKPISEASFNDIENFDGVRYTVEKPKQVYQDLSNKLLVWFAPFHEQYDVPVEFRMFSKPEFRWPTLSKQVANNTTILRIADSNLMSGSFFQNTPNFLNFEEKIQELISDVASDNSISQDAILLYGDSRGGTGALIHALLGNYSAIIVDPILDRRTLFDGGFDTLFGQDILPQSYVDRINHLLTYYNGAKDQIKLITASALLGTFPWIKELQLNKMEVYNLDFKFYSTQSLNDAHSAFVSENKALSLMLINQFLYKFDLTVETQTVRNFIDFWDVRIPHMATGFNVRYLDSGLEITRNNLKTEEKLYFELKKPFEKGKQYTIGILGDIADSLKTISLTSVNGQDFAVSPTDIRNNPDEVGVIGLYQVNALDTMTHIGFPTFVYVPGWHIKLKGIKIVEVH